MMRQNYGDDSKRPYVDDDWIRRQLALHKNAAGIARAHGIPRRTLTRHVTSYYQREVAKRVAELGDIHVVSPMEDEIRVSGNGTVSNDWHLPITNYKLASAMIMEAVATGTTDWLLIVGDFFNFDALSRYDEKQDNAGLRLEKAAANDLMEMLLDVFGTVYLTKGNHDIRFVGKLGYKVKFEESVRMILPNVPDKKLKRLVVTNYDYVIVDTPLGPWRCSHTNQYSKVPLSVPRELCDIHGMHNAAAHRHHHAVGRSKSDYWAVELGGLFDGSKTEYIRQYTNTFPRWTPGWMHLHDGNPYLPMIAPHPTFFTSPPGWSADRSET